MRKTHRNKKKDEGILYLVEVAHCVVEMQQMQIQFFVKARIRGGNTWHRVVPTPETTLFQNERTLCSIVLNCWSESGRSQ